MTRNFRAALVSDIKAITYLHYDSGVKGMLRFLKPKILETHFYKAIMTNPQFYNYVAIDEQNQIIAFMSIRDRKSANKFYGTKAQLNLFFHLVARVFYHPGLILLFINYIRSFFFIEFRYLPTNRNISHEIQILIVSQSNQKKGIGKDLLSNYLKLLGDATDIIVQTQNVESIKFYEKFGFRRIKSFRLINKSLWIYKLRNYPVQ
jgi:RimJ/RimL family protein N-acetyltransferase